MQAFPSEFSIGRVKLAPATVLAPMAGVTDTVFRRFIRNLGGCGLIDRKSTRLNSSHLGSSCAVFCLKKSCRQKPPGSDEEREGSVFTLVPRTHRCAAAADRV